MNANRVSFDRPQASCDACGIPLPEGGAELVELALSTTPLRTSLCPPCARRIRDDGVRPEPLTPRFDFEPYFRVPVATDDDLRALHRQVTKGRSITDPGIAALVARSDSPTVADIDAWSDRIAATAPKPDPLELGCALLAAARLRLDLLHDPALTRIVDRVEDSDEVELCFAAYATRLAGADRLPTGSAAFDARQSALLELAERRHLLATVSDRHPLAKLSVAMRIGVALLLRRGSNVDSLLARLPREDPRTHLLRGLRLVQQDNLSGADREFRIAADDPMVSFDSDVGAAVLWNRAMRAIAATRWEEGRDCLRDFCRQHPTDIAARFVLGHVWLRSAPPRIAREVLASVLDDAAVDHLRNCAESGGITRDARAEAATLYAICLLRLGEPSKAKDLLDRELAQSDVPPARAAELHRTAALVELAHDRPTAALDHLDSAWNEDHGRETAHEIAFAAAAAARRALSVDGIHGFLAMLDQRTGIRDALRRHHGAFVLFLLSAFTAQQVATGQRPAHSFGMEWNWLRARGADANSSVLQAFSALSRHQLTLALQHDYRNQTSGGGAIPFALLSELFIAARTAGAELSKELVIRLQSMSAALARELRGDSDSSAS